MTAVEDGDDFGLLSIGLGPEGVGPFFGDPVSVDGSRGEDQDDEIGAGEAGGDFSDDVRARGDLAFVEPDFDLVGGVFFEEVGEFAHEGFVLAGMAEEDRRGHVSAGLCSYGSELAASPNFAWA